jgi:hypothetical protein
MRTLFRLLAQLLKPLGRRESGRHCDSGHDPLRFAPELFELRQDVLSALDDAGFLWLSEFSSVDPLHDVYGIEVCGIRNRADAIEIQKLLVRMFPRWRSG